MLEQRMTGHPLAIDQLLIDRATGSAWKIAVVEALGDPLERRSGSESDDDEVIYLYGCVAVEHDDERVVFANDVGSKFVLAGRWLGAEYAQESG